jgi:Rieske 2Fe-2S family protein
MLAPGRGRPLEPTEVEPVLRPLGAARPLPARAFLDEEVFAFERSRILAAAWTCVGRTDDVELPGQWTREIVAGEPVLVVRAPDLRLRALVDVCRHRGASLVSREPCGRATRLECPYHGWRYELDGALADAPFSPPGLDRSASGLRTFDVDVWRGFVFVRATGSGPPLGEWLGQTPPWLTEEALASARRGRRTTYDVAANWKLCVENFQESHHFPRVHRALERLTPTGAARSWLTPGPWLGGTMEIERGETVSLDGSRHGRPLLAGRAAGAPGTVFDAMLFPTLLTSLQPDYLLLYRLVPLSAARTRVVADVYFHAAAFVPGFDPRDVYDFWDRVNAEDRAICEDQQANAASQGFDPACYVSVEEGMHAFDRMVASVHAEAHR